MQQKLHPNAVWLFFASAFLPFLIPAISIISYVAFSLFAVSKSDVDIPAFPVAGVLVVALLGLAVFCVILYIWARLNYRFYVYELREDGFRKEQGIIWKRYVTIPYEKIQNVDIYRGLFARILGLSDLHIQTAGASAMVSRHGSFGMGAEGRLMGISKNVAEQVRDELIKRSRQSRAQSV